MNDSDGPGPGAEDAVAGDRAREARLRAAELQTVLDTVPAAIFITRDRDSRHVTANRFCAEVLRMPLGENISLGTPRQERPVHFRFMRDGAEVPRDGLPLEVAAREGRDVRNYEVDIAFEDGTVRRLVGNASPLPGASGTSGAVAAFVDITERKRVEDELHASRAELRALAARLDSIREEEQTRIARDLHDHLGQILTALKMNVRAMERKVDALLPPGSSAELLDRAVDASSLVDEAVAAVQRIAAELRPSVLDRLGVEAALRHELTQFQARTGVACDLALRGGSAELRGELGTAVYRICVEALTNVARHAGASRVVVTLDATASEVSLSIEDDGRGIGDSPHAAGALGITGMRERANRLGGHLGVARRRGGGTVVTAVLPIGRR